MGGQRARAVYPHGTDRAVQQLPARILLRDGLVLRAVQEVAEERERVQKP